MLPLSYYSILPPPVEMKIQLYFMLLRDLVDIGLDIIPGTESSIKQFIELSRKWVDEMDMNDLDFEIHEIKRRMNFVDHCIITSGKNIIGVVKMTYSSFFSLGIDKSADHNTQREVFRLILKDIFYLRPAEIRTTLSSRFKPLFDEAGFRYQFGREKMVLTLGEATALSEVNSEELWFLEWKYFDAVVEMYIDSYRGTIDEKIGMFGEDIAESAIRQVSEGEFGKVVKELSVFYKDGDRLTSGIITSVNENQLFVVIIGTRRSEQGKGIGRKLLTYVITQGRKMGYKTLSLWVTTENISAKGLYTSMNFKSVVSVVSGTLTLRDYES